MTAREGRSGVEREARRHRERLEAGWKAKNTKKPKRRGLSGQAPRRGAERQVRRAILTFAGWAGRSGAVPSSVARGLGVSERTLREWDEEESRQSPSARGRPATRSPRELRNFAIALLHLLGPTTGVPVMQTLFPEMSRREMEDLVGRYKRLHRKHRRLTLHVLRWLRPGSVWAMDLAEPPFPVDGEYPFILAVRDLASGEQLAWVPLRSKEAPEIASVLEALAREYGAPLVMKSDNEKVFRSQVVQAFLDRWRITSLLSPVKVPSYNGSCEAGIGSMKTRTHIEAARHDRVAAWSSDDLEAARLQANTTSRPQGPSCPTPEEAWGVRLPIRKETRVEFIREVERCRAAVRQEAGMAVDEIIDAPTASRCERKAIARALVARGLLHIRRRRVPLPLKRLFAAKIS